MKHYAIIFLAMSVAFSSLGADTLSSPTSNSLIAKINHVTVLELTSNAPIVHYRLLVDGKPVDESRIYEDSSNQLYLAAVPGNSPFGKGAFIHMKIGRHNCMLSAPTFKMGPDNNMQVTVEYTHPQKKVHMDNWITVYSMSIVQHEMTVRKLEVQIKGAQHHPGA